MAQALILILLGSASLTGLSGAKDRPAYAADTNSTPASQSSDSDRIEAVSNPSGSEETGLFSGLSKYFESFIHYFDSLFFQKNKIQKLLDDKNYLQAEIELKALLEQAPNDADYLRVYAAVLLINAKADPAIEIYNQVIEQFPRDMDSRLGRGRAFLSKKDYPSALSDFRYVLDRQGDNQNALKGLADTEQAIQYEAQLQAERAIAQQRNRDMETAASLTQEQKYSEAANIYRSLIEKNENDLEAKLFLARSYALNNQIDEARSMYQSVKSIDPNNVDLLTGEAYLLAKENKNDAAVVNFQRALELDKNNSDALQGLKMIQDREQNRILQAAVKNKKEKIKSLLTRAYKLISFKKYSAAEETLEKSLKEFPNHPEISFYLARTKIFQNKYKESFDLINPLIDNQPDNEDYLNLRGRVFIATGQLDKADSDFVRVLQINKQNVEAKNGIQQIAKIKASTLQESVLAQKRQYLQNHREQLKELLDNNQYSEAIKICRSVLEKYPDELAFQITLAQALALNSEMEEAENLYAVLINKHPFNSELIIGQGFLFLRQGQLNQAQQAFLKAQGIDSDNQDAATGLALLKERIEKETIAAFIRDEWDKANTHIQRGDYETAIQSYQSVLDQHPDNLDTQILLVRAHRLASDLPSAENLLDTLIQSHPGNADLWAEKGQIHSLKGDDALSQESFEKALELRPDSQELRIRIARIIQGRAYDLLLTRLKALEENKEFEAAEALIREHLSKHPKDAQTHYLLARNLRFQNRYNDSIEILNALLSQAPYNMDYLASRGIIWRILRETDKAKLDYEKALSQDPERVDLLLGRGHVAVLEKEYFEAEEYFNLAYELAPEEPETIESKARIENFVKDTVVESFQTETFSGGRDSRHTQRLEWFHPFNSKFRGSVGMESVFISGDADHTGIISGNYDLWDDLNLRGQFSFSPSPDVVAKQIYETEITKSIKGIPLEALFMYRYMDFEESNFHLISPGFNYYLSEHTRVLVRGYFGFQENGNSHSAFLNINHEFSPSLSAYIGGAIGNESFTIVSGADTLAVDSISMQMGIKWRISDRFSIGFNYVYEERKDQFNRNLFGIVIPLRF